MDIEISNDKNEKIFQNNNDVRVEMKIRVRKKI
jgi:hypothetical protein